MKLNKTHSRSKPSANQIDLEIEVGLHVLASRAEHGVPIPDRVINEVCGRSHGWICMMNIRVMRKIRRRLKELSIEP